MDERYGKRDGRAARRGKSRSASSPSRRVVSLARERVLAVRNIRTCSLRAFSVRPRLHAHDDDDGIVPGPSFPRRVPRARAPPPPAPPLRRRFRSAFPPRPLAPPPARSAASVASSAFATSHNPSLANTNTSAPSPRTFTARLTCGSATSPGSSRLRNPSPSVRVSPDPRARVASGGNGALAPPPSVPVPHDPSARARA